MSETVYIEDTWPERGVSYHWRNARVVDRCDTERGTHMEMVHRPRWGLSCYMNGEIQSCEVDEKWYHETLVHPAMMYTVPRRVLILGGGEGATAREVLKWPSVERVDMYEWDPEIVSCFRERYPQWAKGAWDDSRLHLYYQDVFEMLKGGYPEYPYDAIFIDLFEPSENPMAWHLCTRLASDWLAEGGVLAMYAGIRSPFTQEHPAEEWLQEDRIAEYRREGYHMNMILSQRDVYSYRVFIPSFGGEAMFLLLTPTFQIPRWDSTIPSHLSPEIWTAYHTWNDDRHTEPVGVFQGV
jgi:spermidine synthase